MSVISGGTAPNALQQRRQQRRRRPARPGSRSPSDRPVAVRRGARARSRPTGPRRDVTTPTKPYALRGSCAGRSSSTIWCSSPRSSCLQVAAVAQVPDVHGWPYSRPSSISGIDAVLDHVRRAPLAGEHGVVAEVPPEVVGELLRAAVDLPGAQRVEASWSSRKHAARRRRRSAPPSARHVDARPARSGRVRPAVAGLAARSSSGSIVLTICGCARVGLGVDDVMRDERSPGTIR